MSVETEVRVALRAYPPRYRAHRGDELLGTVLDLLPAGARHLPWRVMVDLLVGGLRARWRGHPALYPWLRYRGGLLRQPVFARADHAWMLDDLFRTGWRRRTITFAFVAFVPVGLVWGAVPGGPVLGRLIAGLIAPIFMAARAWWGAEDWRARALRAHGYAPNGAVVPSSGAWTMIRPPMVPNVRVAPFLGVLGVGVLLGASPADPDRWQFSWWFGIGSLLAVLVAALAMVGLRTCRRRDRADGPVWRTEGLGLSSGGAVGALVAVALLGGLLAASAGPGGKPVAQFGLSAPSGVALLAAAGACALVGRRRGVPVGVWDLFPALAPVPAAA